MAHVNRKQYLQIFGMLFVLTILEVGIVYLPISKGLMLSGLIGMAVAKAFLVAWFFMHLNHDAPPIGKGVFYSFIFAAIYAVVLIAEGAWRGGYFWFFGG